MIGVFDSGFGGLTVLEYFLRGLPEHDYLYLGDSARAPYGGRSPETIYNYTLEAVDFLLARGAQLVIIACNTASAQALRRIQEEYLPKKYPERRVLGVVRPLAEAAAEIPKGPVGIIGTCATIESRAYELELQKLNPGLEIISQGAPLLVPLIEEGWIGRRETKMILRSYLKPLKDRRVRALVLACTHYPILMKEIAGIMPKNCRIFNPGEIIAASLEDYLARHPELAVPGKANREFYTTDDPARFQRLGEKFLGEKMGEVKRVGL